MSIGTAAVSIQQEARLRKRSGEKSMLNSFDVSIPLSVAYEYSNVIVSASYNIGLRNVCKQTDGKNTVIMFTAGYKFDLCRL